jgi:gamma-glutamylcyclotransferase (GGCT)/AIG2-like uncharacterized protein YtfP
MAGLDGPDVHLFVYGLLRRDAGHRMHQSLADRATFAGRAVVHGTLFSLGEYPGLVPDTADTGVVAGEVYRIDPALADATLSTLDEFEGIGSTLRHPADYRREQVSARLTDGRRLDAWAYVLDRSPDGLEPIASGDFVAWRRARRPKQT